MLHYGMSSRLQETGNYNIKEKNKISHKKNYR